MSDTPRTDAAFAKVPVSDPTGIVPWVSADFARILERETLSLTASRDALAKELERTGLERNEIEQRLSAACDHAKNFQERLNSVQRTYTAMLLERDFALALVAEKDKALEWYGKTVDALLNHCPVGECMECSKIVCPFGEPLHLHHDGCPACVMAPEDHPLRQPVEAISLTPSTALLSLTARIADEARGPLVEALEPLIDIAARLATQDNRCTENPKFSAQVLTRDYGIDPDWCSDTVWIHDGDVVEEGTPNAIQTGYRERWVEVMSAFTEKGCEEYLKLNGHNHRGETRIYVESFNRCPEMIAIRTALAALAQNQGAKANTKNTQENQSLDLLVWRLVELAKRRHRYCEDSFYSCPLAEDGGGKDWEPKDECSCGADEQNAEVARIESALAGALSRAWFVDFEPVVAIEEAVARFTRPEGVTAEQRNLHFHQLLTRGLESRLVFPDSSASDRREKITPMKKSGFINVPII